MNRSSEIASSLLALVGGKQNVSDVFHCMTRLRLNLKDASLANLEEIEKIEGVLGVQTVSGEIQVIIGAGVESVYNDLIAMTDLAENAAIQENLDPDIKPKAKGIKGFFTNLFNVFSACFSPLVPLFVVIGIFNMIAVLIGPQFLKLVSEESDLYKNFYFVSQAILYFMPILVAYTAARRFKANPLVSIALAGILLYPPFVEIVNAGTPYTVYGIPVTLVSYGQSIIPIMLIVWIQSYVEKLLNKYTPEVIKVIVIPCGTIAIMLPLALGLLGPAGTIIGTGLGKIIFGLYNVAGPVATLLYGAIVVIGVALGFTRPIFFIAMTALFTNGVEYAIMPASMVYLNWVVMGITLGYVVKSKTAKNRQFGITCFASNFLGGVSEPSIFGIIFNHRKLLIPSVIAGAAAGLYSGIMKVGYYAFGPSNFIGVIGFLGGEQSNFIHGCIASGIGFISAFLVTMFVFTEKETPLQKG